MEQLSELFCTELEEAVEVKNSQALRRFTILLSENIVSKREYEHDYGGLRGDIRILAETMDRRFAEMNSRFEEQNRRFESMDKRFDDLIHQMDKRFDDVNARFEDVNKRFEDVNKRFEDQNRRFDDLIHQMDKRFDGMNVRFDESNHKFNLFMTLLSIGLGIIMAILAYGTFFAG